MNYEVIRLACDKLSYREKMKLAQYLIQAAIKEEEDFNPASRPNKATVETGKQKQHLAKLSSEETVLYVKERLIKSKPSKKQSLANFIKAMFQFQGGIADEDVEEIISKLIKLKIIDIRGNKVHYA